MTVSFLQSFGQESPTVALSPTASSAVCQPKPQESVGESWREEAINLADRLAQRYQSEWERHGCFAAKGSAERVSQIRDRLIAGRRTIG